MKYQCSSCLKVFSYPAKQITQHNGSEPHHLSDKPLFPTIILETHVCPYCKNIEFTEYVEPEADITSVKSVPLEEVDNWIAQGYKVRELYAKTGTMVKLEVKV